MIKTMGLDSCSESIHNSLLCPTIRLTSEIFGKNIHKYFRINWKNRLLLSHAIESYKTPRSFSRPCFYIITLAFHIIK